MQKKQYLFILSIFLLIILGSCSSKRALKKANERYDVGEYDRAVQYYQRAMRGMKNQTAISEVFFRQGECYRLTNRERFAENFYRFAINYKYSDSTVFLRYAQVLHEQKKLPQAKTAYETFLKAFPGNDMAVNGLMALDSIPKWADTVSRYIVEPVKELNSRRSDFSPVFVGDDYDVLYFNSTRDGGIAMKNSDITGQKPNDIYMSRKDSKGKWTTPELLEGEINTDYDEGTASLTPDGKVMYFTVCQMKEGKAYGASIFRSTRTGAQWSKPVVLPLFTDSASDSLIVAHPAISAAEDVLYYVSDMPGGFGGKDIWRSKKIGENWSVPVNLGPEINTSGDEMFPYLRNERTLYFSSNGHPGMGGLDLFMAQEDENGNWFRSHLLPPMNSEGDDFGITFAGETEEGFFSSNRKSNTGDNIYHFIRPELQFLLEGRIFDEKSKDPLSDGLIRLVGNDGTNTRIRTKKDGTFSYNLNKGADYVFLVTCRGYLNEKGEVTTVELDKDETFGFEFALSSIKKPIRLNNINFEFGKWDLTEQSKKNLDELVQVLMDNPNITIELGAHTDLIGNEASNLELSEKRAASVMNYLVSKQIKKDRLSSKGYGETQPVIADKQLAEQYDFISEGDVFNPDYVLSLTKEQQEIVNQINRRTEFKVLSTNYKL